MFAVPKDQAEKLKKLKSTYKLCSTRKQTGKTRINPKTNEEEPIWGGETFKCGIIDIASGKAYASGEGETKQDALTDAIKNVNPDNKPKTIEEIVQENQRLREAVKASGGKLPDDPAKTDTESLSDELTEKYKPVKASELVVALKTRGIEVPEGNKGTDEWRNAVIRLLEQN